MLKTHHAVPDLAAALDRLRAWARANGWQPATFARKAGLAENVTRGMDEKDWAPTSRSIRALEQLIPADWKIGDPLPEPKRAPARKKAA